MLTETVRVPQTAVCELRPAKPPPTATRLVLGSASLAHSVAGASREVLGLVISLLVFTFGYGDTAASGLADAPKHIPKI